VGCRVVLTFQAVEDIREIHRYVARHDSEAAYRLRANLLKQVRMLSTFSQAGRMVPEFDNPAIRELIRKPYRIIYRIRENHQLIEVLRFWHAARGEPFV
jgi:toxin ParE1/3/4